MPHTGLKCLNANFIYYATHLPGRGGAFIIYSDFFGDDLHLQIIAIISPKASVENSSAQWAIFFIIIKKQSFICHGSQFSSLFIILQKHMSL